MKYTYEQCIGTRRLYGTQWPVYAVAWKSGEKRWIAAKLCNGAHEQLREYLTRREAVRAAKRLS
jgi:hypothetical protein